MKRDHGHGESMGRHVLADLYGVAPAVLIDPAAIEVLLIEAATLAGATPIFAKFHQFGDGQGVTGVLLLRESHLSIHTWPEVGFAAVDAFMCGDCRPDLAILVVKNALRPVTCQIKEELRGTLVHALTDHVEAA